MERRLETVKKDGGESRPSQTPRRREQEAETTTSDEAQREREGKDPKKYTSELFNNSLFMGLPFA